MQRLISFAALLLVFALPTAAHARDQVAFSNHIVIPTAADQDNGEEIHDVVCAFCTVDVHGPIHGDFVTAFSTIHVDPGVEIDGDTVTAGSRLTLGENVSLRKDLVFFAGTLDIPGTVTVGGDRVVLDGSIWMLALLAPFLIGLGILWLILWALIRLVRPRPRYAYPGYPPPPPPPGYYPPR